MNTEDARHRARKYVKALKSFYLHALIFGLVNGGLLLLNLVTSPHHWWSLWSIFGWGIGLFAHGASVFLFSNDNTMLGKDWEEKKIGEYLSRQERTRTHL
jgi:hypothetical protein